MMAKLKTINLLFIMIILSWIVTPQSFAQEDDIPDDTRPVDIVLLLDSSGSAADQRELIQRATEFLLDYLEANTDFAGLDYRFSVVGFNQGVLAGSAIPLGRPSDANLEKFFTDTPIVGDTDFKPALSYALDEFIRLKTVETGRIPIVMLMTDGQPARQGQPLPDPELNTYFTELGQTITTAVTDTGLQLFVVAVGDAAADQARWQNALPSEEQYRYIDNSSNLSEIYWQFLSEFIGGEQDDILQLTASQTYDVPVEPYLDELSLTVLKDDSNANIQITDPRGYSFNDAPARGGEPTDLHEIYIIPRPSAGDWRITLEGANGRLLVARRYPQIALNIIGQPVVPVKSPFTVQAFLDSASLEIINPERLSLRLVDNPATNSDGYPFTRLPDGSYEANHPGFTASDLYTLSPLVLVDGQPLESIEKQETAIKAVHLPEISSFNVTSGEYGEPFIITYDVDQDQSITDLVPQLEIFLDDEWLKTIEINPHDASKENSLEYLPEQEGTYKFVLNIQGRTPDQLSYAGEETEVRSYFAPEPVVPLEEDPEVEPATTDPTPIEATTPEITDGTPPSITSPTSRELGLLLVVLLALVAGAGYVGFRKHQISRSVASEEQRNDERKGGWSENNSENDSTRGWQYGGEERRKRWSENNSENDSTREPEEPNPHNPQPQFFKKEKEKLDEIHNQIAAGSLTKRQAENHLDELLFAMKDQVEKEITEPASLLTRDIIGEFYQFYEPQNDLDEFYRVVVNPRFRKYKRNRSIAWGIIEELERIWQGDTDRAISYLYDSLLPQTKDMDFLRIFAEHPDNSFKRYATYLMATLETSDEKSLQKLITQTTEQPRHQNLTEIYEYIAELNAILPFAVETKSTQKLLNTLNENRIPLQLWQFVRDIAPQLETLITPNHTLGGWEEAKKNVEAALTIARNYQYLPEATLISRRLQAWQEFAHQQTEGFHGRLMVEPGSLAVEIRPRLDLAAEEKLNSQGNWDVSVPITLYHLGDWPVTKIQTESKSKTGLRFTAPDIDFLQEGAVNRQLIRMGTIAQPDTAVEIKTIFQSSTLSQGDFRVERKQADYLYGSNKLLLAPKPNNWPKEMPLAIPYISDRPLDAGEFERLFKGEDRQLVRTIPEYIQGIHLQSRLISLMGLRRTGKTTLLNLSLQRLQESTETVFLVIKVDLLEWLLRLQREKGYTTLEKELDFYFWFHLTKEFEQAIHQQIGEIFPKQQTEKVYEKLDSLIEATREQEPSIRFVLAFDEADYFGHDVFRKYFQRDESFDVIPGRLLNLVTKYEMIMILVHDNIRVVWQQELVNAYYDMTSSHMLSEYRYFRTHLLDRSGTDGLLKNGPLSFTKLAEETVWAFTGGYASLIQLLYRRLIEYKNQQWANDDTQKLSAVTVEDVKDVVRQEVDGRTENEIQNMTTYLLHSFDGSELRLMLLLAQEGFIDPNTAILTIPYGANWQQLTQLNQKATQLFPDELDTQKLQHALASLIDKQLLTRVQINQTVTTHLRWRVGWLYIYLSSASFDIMLGKLQPVLARFNSSDFAA